LNGLRAYSAIGIAMMHILANIQSGKLTVEPINVIIESFIDFVFLFFMISAFGMCCGYYEKIKNGRISANDFYTKRYKRIWPYFALLCLIGLAFDRTIGGVWQTFSDLTLCFNLLPNPDIKIIGVGWFIGLIFLFYIMFPFFVYLIDNILPNTETNVSIK
jgi:peptidoglycan/LPS O-acetylase OafA/YrhL